MLLDADGVFLRTPVTTWHEINAFTPNANKTAFRDAILSVEDACIANGAEIETELARVLEKWQCSGDVAAFLALWYTIELDFAVLELVASLRSAGILCCTASNQMRGRAMHMSGTLGLRRHFDREFYAYALGALKPHPNFYHAILSQLSIEPSRILFVDDRAQNVEAALAVGMKAHHFPEFGGVDALRTALAAHHFPVD